MILRHDPFALIFGQGDEATRLACLEFFGLADSPQGNACLVRLLRQQRSDGTFPSSLDTLHWGMPETVRHTLLLLHVGMPATGVNVSSAVQFVLGKQNPDGGWCENPALKLPREQTWLSNAHSITWLTADVVDLLHQTGRGECAECQAAVAWLRTMQKPEGGWPSLAGEPQIGTGDPDATLQIVINVAPHGLAQQVLFCGRHSGRDVDKFAATGLTPAPARHVRPPIITKCIAHLECQVVQDIEAGDHRFVIGEVLAAYTPPGVLGDDGLYDLGRIQSLLHLGRNRFTGTCAEASEPSLPVR